MQKVGTCIGSQSKACQILSYFISSLELFPSKHMRRFAFTYLSICLVCGITILQSQETAPDPAKTPAKVPAHTPAKAPAKTPAKARATTAAPQFIAPVSRHLTMTEASTHYDFPDVVFADEGSPHVLTIAHPAAGGDPTGDVLTLLTGKNNALESRRPISQSGVIHQPSVAVCAAGCWTFWGQVNEQDVMTLRARLSPEEIAPEGLAPSEITLAESPEAGNSFADAGTDPAGRVWVTWQEIRPGVSRIFAKHWTPSTATWSEAIAVSPTDGEGGHWEPRLAFTDEAGAWVVYDSSAGSEFNLHLARVSLDGSVRDRVLVETPDYEARAAITADAQGGLWVAAERGRQQWGLDSRGHENDLGLNAGKRLLLGRYDPDKDTFSEVPVPHKGRPTPAPDPSPGFAVNVPSLAVTSDGRVWLGYRYFSNLFWRVALTAYDPATGRWLEPAALPESTMGQDRHQELSIAPDGSLWMTWPSDERSGKAPGIAGVHLAKIDTKAAWPLLPEEVKATITLAPPPLPYLNEVTPPRPLTEHHSWTVGGKTYRLLWGDVHRHTDISNCRTGFDGCIVEAYRYAYDLAGLDFLGTSDHTDIGKDYSPYEWWHTQRQVDVFFAPGQFASLYVYEREQPFPWGHRNIVFAQRGGPIIYINRATYRKSPWHANLPVAPGLDPITPNEVWDLLQRYGQPAAVISHTGATGMGTDWTKYANGIDSAFENNVEIFQGARVSYEALGAAQPTVGLRQGEPYTPSNQNKKDFPMPPLPIEDFAAGTKGDPPPAFNNGVYQKALAVGHKLGVFASSDHIATHTSFGGVYVEDFTREGIIEGLKARRTCAATDKIFVELGCGDRLMGEVFDSDVAPNLTFRILGTASIRRLTIVRNESDYQVIEPNTNESNDTWTDPAPLPGENRYYLRVEQADGNMAWSSPLWINCPEKP